MAPSPCMLFAGRQGPVGSWEKFPHCSLSPLGSRTNGAYSIATPVPQSRFPLRRSIETKPIDTLPWKIVTCSRVNASEFFHFFARLSLAPPVSTRSLGPADISFDCASQAADLREPIWLYHKTVSSPHSLQQWDLLYCIAAKKCLRGFTGPERFTMIRVVMCSKRR